MFLFFTYKDEFYEQILTNVAYFVYLFQEHLGPAILHKLENFPVHSLEFCRVESDQNGLPLELVNKFAEARKSMPCVIYLPRFHWWWEFVSPKKYIYIS